MDLFRAQLSSLREQRDRNWICLISDDCSSSEQFAQVEAELAGDPRFEISRSERRLGFYRNFERALTMVPADAELIALCDQDDRWHPDKLSVLRGELGTAVLVYSDLRLVEADGRVLRETLWQGRSNNHTNLASMLIANTITGAASVFRRELLELLLPFPDSPGFQFHDHWLAVAALAAGDVAYVPRPLYDYVQHRGAVFGHVTHGQRDIPARAPSPGRVIDSLRGLPLRWRGAYFYGYLAREVQAQALLVRCDGRLVPSKRRALERFVSADRSSVALLWLALRPLRLLGGRTETLATEFELARGVVWKRLADWATRRRLPAITAMDAGPPPPDAFSQKRLRRWRAAI
jgi:glycosyltransferase involved in cell wall biosynthesis